MNTAVLWGIAQPDGGSKLQPVVRIRFALYRDTFTSPRAEVAPDSSAAFCVVGKQRHRHTCYVTRDRLEWSALQAKPASV
jgi:hypothetical protein